MGSRRIRGVSDLRSGAIALMSWRRFLDAVRDRDDKEMLGFLRGVDKCFGTSGHLIHNLNHYHNEEDFAVGEVV